MIVERDIQACWRGRPRIRVEEGYLVESNFSDKSDSDLDALVSGVVLLHPQCGEKSVTGRLRSLGYNVQRERVRFSIRHVDPIGVEMRAQSVLHRRRYQMWHLDGWNIVVHGGIYGFSRLIMFLKLLQITEPLQFCQHLLMSLVCHLV